MILRDLELLNRYGIFRLFDFKISGTISAHIFRFMWDICISKHYSEDIGLQKWVFDP